MKTEALLSVSDFVKKGGWVIDTQFVVNMGVPYLLAHGLGTPVGEAVASLEELARGSYYLYVYTYNWVAPWKEQYTPGLFEVSVDGRSCGTFGRCPTWGWECGGIVEVGQRSSLILRDLTGFEGRCGLVYLTKEPCDTLPTGAEAVRAFYRRLKGCEGVSETVQTELTVCGAGIAGICATLSAARQGVKTLLVGDRPVVGGNNSSEVRVWLGGKTNFAPFPSVGNIVNELEQAKVGHYGCENRGENYEDGKKLQKLLDEPCATVLLNHIATGVSTECGQIRSIEVWDYLHDRFLCVQTKLVCDSTGDGTVAYLAGGHFEVTTNGHMGMTNPWYVEPTDGDDSFPSCPWAIDLKGVDFPGKPGVKDVYGGEMERSLGCWFWESGCESDPIDKAEYARDLNLRAMYGAWDALRNHEGAYRGYRLGYASYVGGKRESRRFFGDLVLTKSDVLGGNTFADGCVPSTWNFDVHYPDRRFYEAFREGDGFITKDYHEPFQKPFFIPYRCLYSRNVDNLFLAGRNVSVSHDALGTVRVMRTGGMMGEVVGYAAALCLAKDTLPRQIYTEHLEEFLHTLRTIPSVSLNKLVANEH